MINVRQASQRGHFDHGWLNTFHTFSFEQYYDPRYMGFRSLRVINEDRVAPGRGFPTHGHSDMEILTYILEGALSHQDTIGNGSTIRPGDLQRMTAGTGVRHSEQNASSSQPVHFMQVWILPQVDGLEPAYEQKSFSEAERLGKLKLIASPDGRDDSVLVHQDVNVFATILDEAERISQNIDSTRHGWLQVCRGVLSVNSQRAKEGDGVILVGEEKLEVVAEIPSEFLFFDLG